MRCVFFFLFAAQLMAASIVKEISAEDVMVLNGEAKVLQKVGKVIG